IVVGNLTTATKILDIGYDGTDDMAYLQSRNVGTSNKNLSLNPRGGNVGVGTTTPGANLDVFGTVSASDIMQIGSTTTIACASSVQGALRYTNVSDTL